MKTFLLLTCLIMWKPIVSLSQTTTKSPSFSFLTGTWHTKHEWGDMTEIWSTEESGNLMCTFRCMNGDKVIFYEWIIIESSPEGPVMKLRHFNPGSIAWEDKENPHTYHLLSLGDNKCVFENESKSTRITYERASPTELLSFLERTDETGKVEKVTFDYKNVKL